MVRLRKKRNEIKKIQKFKMKVKENIKNKHQLHYKYKNIQTLNRYLLTQTFLYEEL